MKLNNLYLQDFRNYREENFTFAPGVTLIVGENAQGKTNLLESICYLGSGKSFRTQKTGELIFFGAPFGEIKGEIFSQEREQSLRWLLFNDRRGRQIFRNGIKQKTAGEIAGVLQTVLFCPEDLMLLKGGGCNRRKLADSVLCQLRPNYEAALSEYNRILEQKSGILKNRFLQPEIMDILPEYNSRLCRVGAQLISYRARFFEGLSREAEEYHRLFSGGKEKFSLTYKTVSTVTDPFASIETLTENLQEHLKTHYMAELESAQCLTGPHKDDFIVSLNGLPIKSFGSQGQVRTATISLKLAQRELMKKESGELPLLLLDDVLSELDERRQDFVLNQITQGQVFITCCEPGRFTKLGNTLEITTGKKK